MLRDSAGNLYYSDEFNHCVVSLDSQGRVRWQKDGKGSAAEQFWYPRGMALGWIKIEGDRRRCVAVCDTWNERLKFLDPDGGGLICIWKRPGERGFNEVSDVRYFGDIQDPDAVSGCWLVLDRGNHRLCVIAENGKTQHQIGSPFPPGLACGWLLPEVNMIVDLPVPDSIPASPRLDNLYYPTRILGGSEFACFLVEPPTGRLKQVLLGNLLALPLSAPDQGEWISADGSWFLSWSPRTGMLRLFSAGGDLQHEAVVGGSPIYSDLPAHEIWLQIDARIERWRWAGAAVRLPSDRPSAALLLRGAQEEYARSTQDNAPHHAIREFIESFQALESISRDLQGNVRAGTLDLDSVKAMQAVVEACFRSRQDAAAVCRRRHQRILQAIVALQTAAGVISGGAKPEVQNSAQEMWRRMVSDIDGTFVALQQQRDELHLLLWGLPQVAPNEVDPCSLIRYSLQQLDEAITVAQRELQRWSGISFTMEVCVLPPSAGQPDHTHSDSIPSGFWIAPPAPQRRNFSNHLREVDRISLNNPADLTAAGPYCLAAADDGVIYVTLNKGCRIVRLGSSGKILGTIATEHAARPTGIALDRKGRVWMVDFRNHGVWIYDPGTEAFVTCADSLLGSSGLRFPIGICSAHGEEMLVADWGNHRIVALSDSGVIRELFGRLEHGPGECRHPIAVVRDPVDRQPRFWAADQLNHRILHLDESGNLLQIIGGCGFGRNCLVLPESVLPLPGGLLVVSQWRFNRELKLFSTDGEEVDRLPVDFAPAGMLAHRGLLWIADCSGSDIRIYELS